MKTEIATGLNFYDSDNESEFECADEESFSLEGLSVPNLIAYDDSSSDDDSEDKEHDEEEIKEEIKVEKDYDDDKDFKNLIITKSSTVKSKFPESESESESISNCSMSQWDLEKVEIPLENAVVPCHSGISKTFESEWMAENTTSNSKLENELTWLTTL